MVRQWALTLAPLRAAAFRGAGGQAKEYSIHDVKPFYKSRLFTSNRFTLDEARRVISLPV